MNTRGVAPPGDPGTPAAPRAPYRSTLRAAQAAATRRAVLEAAAGLFVSRGYLRTTMRDVAAASGVSVETVYAQGSKQALLLACVDRALAGDDDPGPMLERPAFAAALAAGTQTEVITAFVRALADVAVRAAGVVVAFEDAAARDADTAVLWAHAERDRHADVRRLVDAVAGLGPLRPGLDADTATAGLAVTLHPRQAHLLGRLGWSSEQVATWTARAVTALLLPHVDGTTT